MARCEAIIIRRDKDDGTTSPVSREFALDRLSGYYVDPETALRTATESSPVWTPFAAYWPAAALVAAPSGAAGDVPTSSAAPATSLRPGGPS